MRRCGKRYSTPDDALASKLGRTGRFDAVGCPDRACSGYHLHPKPGRTPQPQRSGQLARTSRLRPRSKKTAQVYEIRRPLVGALLEAQPWCQIQWDDRCQRRSTDVHEPRMRSRGADITDESQCITGCRYCHDQVHLHPAEATARGFMIPSGQQWEATA